MIKLTQFLTFVFVVSFATQTTYSWNRRGHLMVAAVAYLEVKKNDPTTLDKINEIPIKGYKKIKVVTNGRETSACPQIKDSEILSDVYNDTAQSIAVRQILRAGYRLANGLGSGFLN